MKREIIKTADGSTTIYLPEWEENYHSKHGAIQEAQHVFLQMGLKHQLERSSTKEIKILEIGFGTGLNAFLTLLEAIEQDLRIHYVGVEAYPVKPEELVALNFADNSEKKDASELFKNLHEIAWNREVDITSNFRLNKRQQNFTEISDQTTFDIVYFDAFGPRVQPELWTEDIFLKMYTALKPSGILVTYSAKGAVRRAMQAVGFEVERLPGPPGKRQMLRATKSV